MAWRRPRRCGSAPGTALLGLALVGAGQAFDLPGLYPAGVALTALAAGAVAWVGVAARGASVHREVVARRVVEGEPVELRVVGRPGRLALPGGELRDPLLARGMPVRPGARSAAVRIQARFARRGRRRLAAPQLVISDPLGLAVRTVAAVRGDELLVLPRIEPVRVMPGGAGVLQRSRTARPVPAAEADLDRLAAYQPGTPASRIHWPTLARGAGLHERRLQGDVESRPLVVLDARPGAVDAVQAQARLDAAVRAAASLLRWLAQPAGAQLVIGSERRPHPVGPDLGGWGAAHARLALVEPTATAPGLGALTGRSGTVFYVAADASSLPLGVLAAAGASVVLVVPGGLPGGLPAGRAAFSVGGCQGHVLHRAARARRRRVAA